MNYVRPMIFVTLIERWNVMKAKLRLAPSAARRSRRQVNSLARGIAIALILAVAAVLLRAAATPPPDSPEGLIRAALERAREAGSYRVALDIQQTISPERTSAAPAPISDDEFAEFVVDGYISGLDQARFSIKPKRTSFDLQAQAAGTGAQEILIADDTLYEQVGDQWVKKEGATPVPGVNDDALSLLSVARDVHRLEAVERLPGRFERVGFELRPRDMLELMLSQNGPPDETQLRLAVASGFSFGGTGELWIDESGLPARLVLYLDLKRSGQDPYRTSVLSTADYADFGADFPSDLFDPTISPLTKVSTSPIPGSGMTGEQLTKVALGPIALLGVLGLCWLLMFARFRAKTAVASLVVLVALISPQVAGAVRPVKSTVSEESSRSSTPGSEVARMLQESRAIAERRATRTNSVAAASLPADGDEDQDDLPNGYELSLGTNPFVSDTDMDGLTDYQEVVGFPCENDPEIDFVETNPLLPDSNNDGLRDGDEFYRGQCRRLYYVKPGPDKPGGWKAYGEPYAWTDDNDNDGVPDGLDLSPFTASRDPLGGDLGYIYEGHEAEDPWYGMEMEKVYLREEGADLTFESLDADPGPDVRPYPFYVELQIRADPDLMRAAYKKSVEWPLDSQASIRNWGEGAHAQSVANNWGVDFDEVATTGRLETVPYLEISVKQWELPSQEARELYNITVAKEQCGQYNAWCQYDYKMFVPLAPVERNGHVVALQAKVMHDFIYGSPSVNRRWEDVRLKWAVQGDVARANDDGDFRASPTGSYGLITYDTPYHITGLQVSRQGGTAMLVAGAYPSGTPELFGDGPIALLRAGMEAQFLSGRLSIDQIGARFDINSTATITQRWGITDTYGIKYGPDYEYEHLDLALTTTMITTTRELLNELYPSHNYSPTLILASEQRTSTINVDELDYDLVDFGGLIVNFCGKPMITSRSLKLQTYRYQFNLTFPASSRVAAAVAQDPISDWVPLTLDEMLSKVESEFDKAFPEVQEFFEDILDVYNNVEELYNEALNIVKMASTVWHMGQTAIEKLGNIDLKDTDQLLSDAEMLVEFLDQNGLMPKEYAQVIYVVLDVLQAGGPGVWLENQFNEVVSFVEGAIEKIGSFFDGSPGFSMPDEKTMLSWTNTAINVLNALAAITGIEVLAEIAQILTRMIEIYKYVKQLIDTVTTVVNTLQSTASSALETATAFLKTMLDEAKALSSSMSVVGLLLQVGMTWANVFVTLASNSLSPLKMSALIARAIVETIILVVMFVIVTVIPYGYLLMVVIAVFKAIEAIFGIDIDPVSIFLNWFFDVDVTQLSDLVESATKMGAIQFRPIDPLAGLMATERFRLTMTSTVTFQGTSAALDQSAAGVSLGGGPGAFTEHFSAGNLAQFQEYYEKYEANGEIRDSYYGSYGGHIRFWVDADTLTVGGASPMDLAFVWKEVGTGGNTVKGSKQYVGGDQYRQQVNRYAWADFVPKYPRVDTWLTVWITFHTQWLNYYCSPYLDLIGECYSAQDGSRSHPELAKLWFDILPSSLGQFWWNWDDVTNWDPDGDGLEGYVNQNGQLVGPEAHPSSGMCTSHDNWDTDGDLLSDKFEYETDGVDPCVKDSDYDGLDDGQELLLGTLPDNADTDGDGLKDGQEVAYWEDDAVSLTVPWRVPLSDQYPGLPDPAAFPNPRHANFDQDHRTDKREKIKLSSPNGFDMVVHEPPELIIDPHLIQGGGTGITVQTSPWMTEEGSMLDVELTITLPVTLANPSWGVWLDPINPNMPDYYNNATLQPGSGPYVYTWSVPPIWRGRHVKAELSGLPAIPTGPVTVTTELAYTHLGTTYVLSDAAPMAINFGGPVVSVDTPQAGAILSGETTLAGSASDPDLVSHVYVCAVTTLPCLEENWFPATLGGEGWSYQWTPPADDVYTIQAQGIDSYGLHGPVSVPISVSVDSTLPPAARFDLRNTAYLSTTFMTETLATVRITGRISDTAGGAYVSGVDEAVLLIDDGTGDPTVETIPAEQPGQISSAFSHDWSVPIFSAYQGTLVYDLALSAVDRAGNTSPVFDTLRVVIDDTPPIVYARVPQVAAGSAVTLSGRVDDAALSLLRLPDPPYTPSMTLDSSDSVFVASADTSKALVVGDVNGDTIDDVVLLEPSTALEPMEAGLFFGRTGGFSATLTMADADVRFQGEAVGAHSFAPAAAGYMDVNGDGVGDLLLGDPHANSNSGRAYLILGRRGGGWTSPFSLADADGQWDVFRAVAFGGSVAAAGDVDGDGLSDFMVGAVHDGDRAGVAYLYLGREQGVPELAATLRSPYATVASPAPPNLTGLGDTDGDGLSDVLIAYPGSGAFTGTVALVNGRSQAEWPAALVDLDTFAEALFTAQGDLQTVSPVGDVNRDGLQDLLIGDPTAAQQRVFLLFGRRPEDAWPQPPTTVDLVTSADASYLKGSTYDNLGAGLTPMGDLDRDGRADFAFGNFGNSGPFGFWPSNVAIVHAAEMSLTLDMSPWSGSSIVSGSSYGQRTGEYLSSGDVNGDGVRDLLVGSPGDTRAYLLTGDPGVRDGSGVQAVKVGLYGPVADPSLPYTDTLPAAWEMATLASPGDVLTPWSAVVAPPGDGDYRVYARAKDELGNTWTAQSWYLGNVWVNTSPVSMTGESGVFNPPDLVSKTNLSLTGIVTSPQPIQHLRVYDGYEWYRHLPATGAWSNDSVIPRADLRTLTFRAVARDAYGHTLHVSRTLMTDTFVLAPVLSSKPDANQWQTDISPTLSVMWSPVPDASGIISTWATIDISPGTVPTTPVSVNEVTRTLDQPGIYYGHAAVRDRSGNSHAAHIGPFPVNRSRTPSVILPDGWLDTAGGEYPDGTLLNYDPYAAAKPAALWGTWNADELYLGFTGNPWWEYDRLSIYLDTQPGGITGTLTSFRIVGTLVLPGASHTLPFEADYALTIGGSTDCADQGVGSETCLAEYSLYQADGSGWTEVVSPTSFAVTALDTEIVLDRGEIEALGATPVNLLAYAEDETGVWAVLPGGARPTTTGHISGTVAFADNLAWPSLGDGIKPNEGQDQVIAPIVEILTSWDTTLFRNTTTAMTVTVTNPDIAPYINAPVTITVGLSETQGLIGLVGAPVGATCISCPDQGHQWVLGMYVDAYSTQTVTLWAQTLATTQTGVFSLPVQAAMTNTGLQASAQSLGSMQPVARARYNLDQGVATLQVVAKEGAKYVRPGLAGLDILVGGDFLGCWQTVEVDYGLGVGFQELGKLGYNFNITGTVDPDSSQEWQLRVVSDNGQVSPIVSGMLVADDEAPTAQISPVSALSGNVGVIRGTAADTFPTTRSPNRVEVSVDGGRFLPVHTASVAAQASGMNSAAAQQAEVAWIFPLRVTNEDGRQVQVVARAIDEAGNVGPNSDPVTITLDGVGPVITGTRDANVIYGHVSDGSGVALFEASLDGGAHYEPVALAGEDWTFDMNAWSGSPPLSFAMLRATDVYDNVSHAVIPIDFALERVYLPLVVKSGP